MLISGNVYCRLRNGHSAEAIGGSEKSIALRMKRSDISSLLCCYLWVTVGKSLILHRPLVFVGCMTNCHKLSGLKHKRLSSRIISEGQGSRSSFAGWSWLRPAHCFFYQPADNSSH